MKQTWKKTTHKAKMFPKLWSFLHNHRKPHPCLLWPWFWKANLTWQMSCNETCVIVDNTTKLPSVDAPFVQQPFVNSPFAQWWWRMGCEYAFGGFWPFLLLWPFINSKILHLTHSLRTFTLAHSETLHFTLATWTLTLVASNISHSQ
jgi:hypothetical protein